MADSVRRKKMAGHTGQVDRQGDERQRHEARAVQRAASRRLRRIDGKPVSGADPLLADATNIALAKRAVSLWSELF